MEDSMSSTNQNKAHFSDDELEFSSEGSSWSSYFDNSVSTSNTEDNDTDSNPESSSSLFTVAAVSVKKMSAEDDHVALARSAAKRRKTRAAFIDHDLEDTATSPVCNSEVKDLEQFHMNLQDTGCSLSTLPTWQHGKRDYGSLFQEIQNTFHHSGYTLNDINCTGLKEKGLCLVPVSLLFPVSDDLGHYSNTSFPILGRTAAHSSGGQYG